VDVYETPYELTAIDVSYNASCCRGCIWRVASRMTPGRVAYGGFASRMPPAQSTHGSISRSHTMIPNSLCRFSAPPEPPEASAAAQLASKDLFTN